MRSFFALVSSLSRLGAGLVKANEKEGFHNWQWAKKSPLGIDEGHMDI
ncbi:uncharacterized protein G2W53_020897 [Senna tora]|uniref:Uncharacterized protein n=1 Tax=Senna tora TaxID=362788 RepID=A0A834WJ41_9FABA|nr:uncharacterized protein G2W53_020897 [Senna tora]